MSAAPLDARNRRTATRIVGGVLICHSLALGAGVWVLHHATHAGESVALATIPVLAAGTAVAVQRAPSSADAVRAELPDWVLKSRSSDAAAPWRVDAEGHVVLSSNH